MDALEWMHCNGVTHNDLHIDNVAVGYHNKSKLYLFGNWKANWQIVNWNSVRFGNLRKKKRDFLNFFIDFSLAKMNDSRKNTDLSCVSRILNEMLRTRLYDEARSWIVISLFYRYFFLNRFVLMKNLGWSEQCVEGSWPNRQGIS